MPGPAPKPAHLRQRTNRKPGAAILMLDPSPYTEIPPIWAHPDGRVWHEYTLRSWQNAWASPMARQWPKSDFDTMFRLAMKWDDYYLHAKATDLAEIRLQEQRFGLSPLDRSRLQWEIKRAEDGPKPRAEVKRPSADPRKTLMMAMK